MSANEPPSRTEPAEAGVPEESGDSPSSGPSSGVPSTPMPGTPSSPHPEAASEPGGASEAAGMSSGARYGAPSGPLGGVLSEPSRGVRRVAVELGSWLRRLARLWGFLAFAVLVVVLTRHVILPFVFALLLAFILAPVVRYLSHRDDGSQRMPRWVAIVLCYLVFLGVLVSSAALVLPRFSDDASRIGANLPTLYERVNDEWAPALAEWLESNFPADEGVKPLHEEVVTPGQSVYLPPDTAFVLTPLDDGRLAVELPPGSLSMLPRPDGGFELRSGEPPAESVDLETRIRLWTSQRIENLQTSIGDLVSFGQSLMIGLARSVFTFFLVMMVGAFILLDLEKLHGFARSLIPMAYRDDFDLIAKGINRGLSGVIRGQLIICLVNGVLTYIGLFIFNVEYALVLALVAGIMSVVPIFGSILSTIPVVIVALFSGEGGLDVARALAAFAWIVGIHLLEANVLDPKIMSSAARIHPVLVIFALIVGEHYFGLVGAILAVPVTSMVQVLFMYFRRKAWKLDAEMARVERRVERRLSRRYRRSSDAGPR